MSAKKICKVIVNKTDDGNILVREDAQEWPAERYIYPDVSGVVWLWDGPSE